MNINDIVSNIQSMKFNISDYAIDFQKFGNWQYFTVTPSASFKFYFPAVALGLLFLVLSGVIFWFNRKKVGLYPPKNKYFKKIFLTSAFFGFFVLISLFFRSERVPFLSTRLFALVALLIGLLWFAYLGYFYFQRLPLETRKYESWQLKQKYLPKSKKKR